MRLRTLASASLLALLLLALAACGRPREDWVSIIRATTPGSLCEQEFFSSCFSVDLQTCTATAKPIVDACLDEVEALLPERLNTRSGGEWGERVGACAGERLAIALEAHLEVTDGCARWVEANLGREALEQIRREAAESQ
jgi:hypothetical protein